MTIYVYDICMNANVHVHVHVYYILCDVDVYVDVSHFITLSQPPRCDHQRLVVFFTEWYPLANYRKWSMRN